MPPSVRRTLASLGAWIAGAGVAVAVGILALSLIGGGLASGEVRPVPEDGPVVAAPTASPSSAPSPSTGPSITLAPPLTRSAAPSSVAPSPVASGPSRQLASTGGTVIARCAGPSAYLVSWSPAQGYEVDDVHRGPGWVASVVFQGDGQRVWLGVHCVAGIPERVPDRHHDD